MTIFQAILLGIVEGVTEFLPISSTGHMTLVAALAGISQTDFVKSFEIVIQLGAILSVAILYWRKLAVEKEISKRILLAFFPTGVIGFVLYRFVKAYFIGNVWLTVVALAAGGLFMVVYERATKKTALKPDQKRLTLADLSYSRCIAVGLIQSLSMVPGVSRSGATIIGGMVVGLSRVEATEFSFLVATPTLLAASGLDLVKSGLHFTAGEWGILGVGFVVAFIMATVTILWMMKFLQKHSLATFGWYRIVLAILFAAVFVGH